MIQKVYRLTPFCAHPLGSASANNNNSIKTATMKTKIDSLWSAVPSRRWAATFVPVILITMNSPATAAPQAGPPTKVPELKAAAQVLRDGAGVAHILAGNEHDLFFLQGYVHAQDRLFQMDVNRHLASGRLAELFGEGALPQDVQLRTIGLRRAAERSLAVQSPRILAALQAYADGVNSFIRTGPLPPEYGVLELTQVEPWTPVDSLTVVKAIAFQRSFDNDIEPTVTLLTYQQAGQALGFNGAALYFEDLFRTAPFDPTVTFPEGSSATRPMLTAHNLAARANAAPFSVH